MSVTPFPTISSTPISSATPTVERIATAITITPTATIAPMPELAGAVYFYDKALWKIDRKGMPVSLTAGVPLLNTVHYSFHFKLSLDSRRLLLYNEDGIWLVDLLTKEQLFVQSIAKSPHCMRWERGLSELV